MGSPDTLSVPASDTTVKVSIIDTSARLKLPWKALHEPQIQGCEYWGGPSYSFLIEHGPSGAKLLYDLSIGKDLENLPSPVKDMINSWGVDNAVTSTKNVSDVLVENGVDLGTITAIIWSHRHFDHNGDPSVFPPSTSLVVGPGFRDKVGKGYPHDATSPCLASAWEGRELVELDFEADARATRIGRWQALDWFGDGSFYLLRSVGHTVDHISGFARTKLAAPSSQLEKDEFLLMGGDVAHHCGEFRPNAFGPIPVQISPDPRRPPYAGGGGFCPGEYYAQRNTRHRGDDRWRKPFLSSSSDFMDDLKTAEWSIDVVGEFDAHDNVFMVFAHDATLLDVVEFYPKDANEWKSKGWRREGRWRFLEVLKGAD
ncbi:hypothetical protein F4780DRAFT_771977 [Xylariomycetidae sp. FL0641]|nr:hypothetical protein F4780DRAFT_771977 [Xylariomycetidae sp. FL0641]